MPRCEDYPCCGHTPDDPCPERNKRGEIVGRCVECGGRLKKGFRSSICDKCQRRMASMEREGYGDHDSDYY